MFQRQYEDDADVVTESGEPVARGYARLVLERSDEGASWRGTFRVTEPVEPPHLEGPQRLRLRGGAQGEAEFVPTEDVQGEVAGRAGTFFEVTGAGPAPF